MNFVSIPWTFFTFDAPTDARLSIIDTHTSALRCVSLAQEVAEEIASRNNFQMDRFGINRIFSYDLIIQHGEKTVEVFPILDVAKLRYSISIIKEDYQDNQTRHCHTVSHKFRDCQNTSTLQHQVQEKFS